MFVGPVFGQTFVLKQSFRDRDRSQHTFRKMIFPRHFSVLAFFEIDVRCHFLKIAFSIIPFCKCVLFKFAEISTIRWHHFNIFVCFELQFEKTTNRPFFAPPKRRRETAVQVAELMEQLHAELVRFATELDTVRNRSDDNMLDDNFWVWQRLTSDLTTTPQQCNKEIDNSAKSS